MRLSSCVGVLAMACAGGCASPELGTRADQVIGGAATPEGVYPGVGALLYDLGDGPEAGCTGTLIAPTVVLTAAHCVDPQLGGDALLAFTLAHDTVRAPPAMVAIERKVQHAQFSLDNQLEPGLGQWFDIGLVFLATPITEVAPVLLPRPDHAPDVVVDLDLAIVGYGRTSNASGAVGVKHDATTKLVSLNAWELQVAGGGGQPQNCHGDSGGPALAELDGARVVGVVSRSFDLSQTCLAGGTDTRVDAYLTWMFEEDLPGVPCGSGLAPGCEDEGGCSASGRTPAAPLALAVVALWALSARRRRRRPRP